MNFIPTIGLEVHVQLRTRSKMFCGCPVEYGSDANTHTCPVCLGMPGALPVMNEEALRLTALTGLMLGCEVPEICKFDRKNYFYPDMPKNYQITQFDQPICLGGAVPLYDLDYPKDAQKSIAHPGKKVRLTRIHLEEDVAKSFHFETSTGIDFNRAGTPLMEIVSEPEIESPEEAFAFLTSLQKILQSSGVIESGEVSRACWASLWPSKAGIENREVKVSDADMEKGQLRCDCNVSIAPEGSTTLGTKIEIKNMNSISAVRRALAYEIDRQTAALEKGEQLVQSTRGWDDVTGQTFLMRTKEMAHDYRYFPDPDLLPVKSDAFMDDVHALRHKIELPSETRERFMRDFGNTEYDASVLAAQKAVADYYNRCLDLALRKSKNWSLNVEHTLLSGYFDAARTKSKAVANWIVNDLMSALKATDRTIEDSPISPEALAELANLVQGGSISRTQGAKVFAEMFDHPHKNAAEIVNRLGMKQESDTGAIEALCDQAIAANPRAVAEYQAGKLQAINAIKGQVMKLSQGKANPALVGQILERMLK